MMIKLYLRKSGTLIDQSGNKISEQSFQICVDQFDPLPRTFIAVMITDTNYEFDH